MINRRKLREFFIPKKKTIVPIDIIRENPFKRSVAQLPNGECLMKGEVADLSVNISGVKLYTIPPETPGEWIEHPWKPLLRRPKLELNLFMRIKYGENENLGIFQPHNYRIIDLPGSNYVYDKFSTGFESDFESTGFFRKLGQLGFVTGNIFFDSSKKIITRAYREQFWIENTQEWLVNEHNYYGDAPFYRFLEETWDEKLDTKDSINGQNIMVFQDVTGWTVSYEGETYAWNLKYGYPYSLGYPFDIGRDEEGNLYLVSGRKLIFEEDFTDEYPFISIERDQYLIEEIFMNPKYWGYATLYGTYHNTVDFRLYVYRIDKQTMKVNTEPIIEVPYYQNEEYMSYADWNDEDNPHTFASVDDFRCFKNLAFIAFSHVGISKNILFIFNYLTGEKIREIEAPDGNPGIVVTTNKKEKFYTFYFYSPWGNQYFLIDEFGNCIDITGYRNDNHWDGYFIDKQKSDSKELFIIRDTDKKLLRMITHGEDKTILAEIEVNWINATSTSVVDKLLCYKGRIFYSDYKNKDIYEVFPYFDEETNTWKSFQQLLYDGNGSPVKILNGYLVMSNMKTFFLGNGKFEESKLVIIPEGVSSFLTKLATHNDHQFEDIVNYTFR